MKRQHLVFAVCFLMTMFTSCGPSTEEAIQYNDSIIEEQTSIVNKINTIYESLNEWEHPEIVDDAYKQALAQVDSGTEKVSRMAEFGGNSELRDASLKLFAVYKSVIQSEMHTMIEILEKPGAEITPETETQFDEMHNLAMKKMDNGLSEFQDIQLKFATKYNFELYKEVKTE